MERVFHGIRFNLKTSCRDDNSFSAFLGLSESLCRLSRVLCLCASGFARVRQRFLAILLLCLGKIPNQKPFLRMNRVVPRVFPEAQRGSVSAQKMAQTCADGCCFRHQTRSSVNRNKTLQFAPNLFYAIFATVWSRRKGK